MVESGEVPRWQKLGNDAADKFAKAGAQRRRFPEQLRLEVGALKGLQGRLDDDFLPEVPVPVCPPCVVSMQGLAGFPLRGHLLLAGEVFGLDRAIVFCGACGCFSERKPKLLVKKCKGKTAPGTKLQRELLASGVFHRQAPA